MVDAVGLARMTDTGVLDRFVEVIHSHCLDISRRGRQRQVAIERQVCLGRIDAWITAARDEISGPTIRKQVHIFKRRIRITTLGRAHDSVPSGYFGRCFVRTVTGQHLLASSSVIVRATGNFIASVLNCSRASAAVGL